jgi:hypothetical protein
MSYDSQDWGNLVFEGLRMMLAKIPKMGILGL